MAQIKEFQNAKPVKVMSRSLPDRKSDRAEAEQEVLLTTENLAIRWVTSVTQVTNQRGRGIGPRYIRIGHRTVRYRLRDVIAYEQSREMTVTA